jgi:hypothetical protein
VPDIEEPLSPEAVWSGEDNQLKQAVSCLKDSAPAASTGSANDRLERTGTKDNASER